MVVLDGVWNWRDRRKTLARIRLQWGRPVDRERDMVAVASYHHARAGRVPETSIDDRTWRDLDMDVVYALLDRAESSVGQQSLYHRLRSSTSRATLGAFEALVSRASTNGTVRERSQVVLATLR